MPELLIIAGCNGAGKTTAAYTLLPQILAIKNFVNADEIARGLSPFDVVTVAFEAGRIMLQRIDTLLNQRADFAIETTLSTRSYVQTIGRAKSLGYTITLFYVWLESVTLAKERVANRVAKGGHDIPADVIERRYNRSLHNLNTLYLPACDQAIIVDNSGSELREVAECWQGKPIAIFDTGVWHQISHYGT